MSTVDRQPDAATCTRAWQTLRIAHDRVARHIYVALGGECGLTLHEFDVLLYLRTHADHGAQIGGLRGAVSLSQPALSRLVARLVARGLVTRAAAAGDRRAATVTLTDAGAALADRALAIHAQCVRETVTGKLSDAEQADLVRLLRQIGDGPLCVMPARDMPPG